MRALITARYLMSAPRVWKFSDINMLDVSARDRQRHNVFGLASGRTGMTADAARVVNDLRPLYLMIVRLIDGEFSHWLGASYQSKDEGGRMKDESEKNDRPHFFSPSS